MIPTGTKGDGELEQYNVVEITLPKKTIYRIHQNNIFSGFKIEYRENQKKNTIESRRRSNSRAKKRIQDLINLNFTNDFSFLTLTYRENLMNIELSNKIFTSFIRRLKYYLKQKKTFTNFKYIAVLENQKRGSIHYHIICNLPKYINFKDLIKIWNKTIKQNKNIKTKGGSIKVKFSEDSHYNSENLGFYLTKYLTKNFDNPLFCGKKLYFCSKNLKKPIRKNHLIDFKNKDLEIENVIKKLEEKLLIDTTKILKYNSYINPYTNKEIFFLEIKNN